MSSTGSTSTCTIHTRCHCNSLTYSLTIPTSALPLPAVYNHNTFLRLTLGFQFALLIRIDQFTKDFYLRSVDNEDPPIGRYESECHILYFCAACGTSLSYRDPFGEDFIFAPTIDLSLCKLGEGQTPKLLSDLSKPIAHIFMSDTFKGDFASLMDDDLARFQRRLGSELYSFPDVPPSIDPGVPEDVIQGECHCGSVSFSIQRPPPDFLSIQPLARWVKACPKSGRPLFCAGICFCRSCRQTTGAPFLSWAFVPRSLISFSEDSEASLKIYQSFEDKTRFVRRRFCASCGCHLFFATSNVDGELWDVSVSVLDLRKVWGEEWLLWRRPQDDGVIQDIDRYING
ncbi:hypothetical protein BT69DRAFT_1277998 [Atractiella rhizophila]|nr:hypothetical protein BT69DRAFT_1277998 [Atractiella rhizophila]